jgi:predicted transcriptional regulator
MLTGGEREGKGRRKTALCERVRSISRCSRHPSYTLEVSVQVLLTWLAKKGLLEMSMHEQASGYPNFLPFLKRLVSYTSA